jgi:predicted tellurium resistance membrane protein TerC
MSKLLYLFLFSVFVAVFLLYLFPRCLYRCYHSFPLVSYIIFFFRLPTSLILSSLDSQTCEHVKTCSVLSYNPLTLTSAVFRTGECWIMDILSFSKD